MNCLTARKIILNREANDINVDISVAQLHVNNCPDCQLFLSQLENLKHILKTRLMNQPAPAILREKILALITAERLCNPVVSKRTYFKRRILVGAGTAAVISILLLMIYQNPFQRKIEYANMAVRALAQDHIASKLRGNSLDLQTSDTAELEHWFSLRVDFAVRIPTLNNLSLLGGRLCVINGERVVSLAFQKQSVSISLFIVDGDVIDLSRMRVIDARNRQGIYHGDAKGCNVILWQEKGLIFSLVSEDMNEHELIELVAKS